VERLLAWRVGGVRWEGRNVGKVWEEKDCRLAFLPYIVGCKVRYFPVKSLCGGFSMREKFWVDEGFVFLRLGFCLTSK
jgi:hypothetical protein